MVRLLFRAELRENESERAILVFLPRLGNVTRPGTLSASVRHTTLVVFHDVRQRGRPRVDITLRLDVLAIGAAFALIGAILLGAF